MFFYLFITPLKKRAKQMFTVQTKCPLCAPPEPPHLQARAAADGSGDDLHDHDLDEQAGGVGAVGGQDVVHVVKALQVVGAPMVGGTAG